MEMHLKYTDISKKLWLKNSHISADNYQHESFQRYRFHTVTSRQVFISNAMTQAVAYFSGGEVQWLTGANAGRRIEIKEFANKQFVLVLPMPNAVAVGDTFKAIAGCDKIINTCAGKFANAANFRGEPYVPGMDKVLATAATANDLQRA